MLSRGHLLFYPIATIWFNLSKAMQATFEPTEAAIHAREIEDASQPTYRVSVLPRCVLSVRSPQLFAKHSHLTREHFVRGRFNYRAAHSILAVKRHVFPVSQLAQPPNSPRFQKVKKRPCCGKVLMNGKSSSSPPS